MSDEELVVMLGLRATADQMAQKALNLINRQRDRIEAQAREIEAANKEMVRWRSAFQSVTPGGSEFMSPESVKDYMRRLKDEVYQAKVAKAEANKRVAEQAREIEELAALYKEQAKRHADNLAAQQGHIDLFSKRAEAAEARVAALEGALRVAQAALIDLDNEAVDDERFIRGGFAFAAIEAATRALTENTDAR